MAELSPTDRRRLSDPEMVSADVGIALGAELCAVKKGLSYSTWAPPYAERGNRVAYSAGSWIWNLNVFPNAYGQHWVPTVRLSLRSAHT